MEIGGGAHSTSGLLSSLPGPPTPSCPSHFSTSWKGPRDPLSISHALCPGPCWHTAHHWPLKSAHPCKRVCWWLLMPGPAKLCPQTHWLPQGTATHSALSSVVDSAEPEAFQSSPASQTQRLSTGRLSPWVSLPDLLLRVSLSLGTAEGAVLLLDLLGPFPPAAQGPTPFSHLSPCLPSPSLRLSFPCPFRFPFFPLLLRWNPGPRASYTCCTPHIPGLQP